MSSCLTRNLLLIRDTTLSLFLSDKPFSKCHILVLLQEKRNAFQRSPFTYYGNQLSLLKHYRNHQTPPLLYSLLIERYVLPLTLLLYINHTTPFEPHKYFIQKEDNTNWHFTGTLFFSKTKSITKQTVHSFIPLSILSSSIYSNVPSLMSPDVWFTLYSCVLSCTIYTVLLPDHKGS